MKDTHGLSKAERNKEIVSDYHSGMSVTDIAMKYDLGYNTVYKIVRRIASPNGGLARRGYRASREMAEKLSVRRARIEAEKARGAKGVEIAQIVGCSPSTVYGVLKGVR